VTAVGRQGGALSIAILCEPGYADSRLQCQDQMGFLRLLPQACLDQISIFSGKEKAAMMFLHVYQVST
jgi:hypothetical protein